MAHASDPQFPPAGRRLRSQAWFDNPENPAMTALYLERYLNDGFTLAELTSGKPIIGIAQTGSDLSPCNRHHLQLAQRVREGIVAAGGIAFEFPCHPIQETGKRPTAALDRNLAYLSLVEVLYDPGRCCGGRARNWRPAESTTRISSTPSPRRHRPLDIATRWARRRP